MALSKIVSVLLILFALNIINIQGRKFDKCSMARKLLLDLEFPRSELNDWVCLIEHESGYNTRAMNKHNTDGSYDWGLFQINDMYWCDPKRTGYYPKGNGCNIDCDALISDDISIAADCAQHIKKQPKHGFGAWVAWKKHCQGRHFDLSDCDLPTSSRTQSCQSRWAYR